MKRITIALCLTLLTGVFGCSNEDNNEEPYTPNSPKERTTIFYLVGDNNLTGYIAGNLEQICYGLDSRVDNEKVNILAYIDLLRSDGDIPKLPSLYQITYDSYKQKGDTICIERFPEHNSVSKDKISEFLKYVQKNFPAESYSLIWGSHGNGWYPSKQTINGTTARTLGPDGDQFIEMDELHEAIPDSMTFEFMFFDACFMGQAELAMQFKDKTKYLIASPTEIPAKGNPYDLNVSQLCTASTEEEYKEICEIFWDRYTGSWRTISLIKTDGIDRVAECFKAIIDTCSDETLRNLDLIRVQKFDGTTAVSAGGAVCYDLLDIAYNLLQIDSLNLDSAPEYKQKLWNNMRNSIDAIIPYKANSHYIASNVSNITIDTYCGISSYWPQSRRSDVNWYYYNYEWCYKSGIEYVLTYLTD
ncbi:MAG: hypothetical protein J6K74_03045 [Marinifilaceae bacterium]|nr:hypothetical protein [Marinifilaceae bacterium]